MLTVLELFAGIGGLGLGLEQSGGFLSGKKRERNKTKENEDNAIKN